MEITTAIIAFFGVIVGATITGLSNYLIHRWKEEAIFKRDAPRRKLLLILLESEKYPQRWRKLETLKHVIGADDETTKRLLIEVGARASEDGKNLWGLLRYHPLEEIKE